MSGLVCNFEKTIIMPTNQIDDLTIANIQELGFTVSNSFKLLGLNILAVTWTTSMKSTLNW